MENLSNFDDSYHNDYLDKIANDELKKLKEKEALGPEIYDKYLDEEINRALSEDIRENEEPIIYYGDEYIEPLSVPESVVNKVVDMLEFGYDEETIITNVGISEEDIEHIKKHYYHNRLRK